MHAAVAAIVSQRAGDRVVDRGVGIVLDMEREQCGRHRQIAVVVRNERAERRHPHPARKGVAMELDFGDRKSPDKSRVVEMRDAGHRVAIRAKTETVEFAPAGRAGRQALVRAIENASVDQLAVALGLDGEMAVAVVLMDCRSIANAPVDQPSAARQARRCRSPSAERKGDMLPARAAIHKPVVDPRASLACAIATMLISQFLMPLMATPSITIFCASRKNRMTGSTDMLIAAMTRARLPEPR